MRCSNCGKSVPSEARFCPECGALIAPEKDVKSDITGMEPHLDKADPSTEMMPDINANGKDKLEDNVKKSFVWKDRHTYIAICVGLVLAVIIGFTIRSVKDKAINDNHVAINQENDVGIENEYEDMELDNNTPQEYYNEQDSNAFEEDELREMEVDVEEEVLNIREEYNEIVDAIQSGNNYKNITNNGISAYFDGNAIRAIRVSQGVDGNYYATSFYYDKNGSMIFAYYEADDANRFYFRNSKLIRWRYSANANDAQKAENHDIEDSDQFGDWENTVLNDNRYYMQLMTGIDDSRQGDYILPESNSRYLDISDLYGLSAEECRLARNELYARHGRKFDDEGLRIYFENKEWYTGTINSSDFTEDILNDYEIYNRDMIVEYEKEQGYR